MDFHGSSLISIDFGVWVPSRLKVQPADLEETFARFQAGFLSSEDFHRISQIFMEIIYVQRFSRVFIELYPFSRISGMGL